MKTSIYNHIFDTQEGTFAFNSITDSFISISEEIKKRLIAGNVDTIKGEARDILLERHFIVPDEENELQTLMDEYEKAIDSNVYHLTLLPTLDCNVNCWYCFENQQKGSRLHPVISNSIVAHIKYLLANRPHIEIFVVTLFGGEPLLYFKEELYPLLMEMKQLLSVNNKTAKFFFVTNGVCLTLDNILLLKDLEPNFQISIDGYKQKHDTVKKIKGREGISSYDLVMENISLLVANLNSHINLRINYDNNTLNHITDIIDSIKDIPRNKVSIHLERVWQTTDQCSTDNVRFKKAIETFIENGFYVTYLNYFRKSTSCKASQENQAVISYDGSVYKCSGRDFTREMKEGILRTDGTIKWLTEKKGRRLSIKTYDNPKCKGCKMLPLCWGPCCQKQLESLSTGEDLNYWCQLHALEISLDDYLYYRMKSKLNKKVV